MPLDTVSNSPNPHLPAHLREVCDILARGLLRLRSRGMPVEDTETAKPGDIRLHFTARQRLHANPKRKGIA
jgi:hypothetical protein